MTTAIHSFNQRWTKRFVSHFHFFYGVGEFCFRRKVRSEGLAEIIMYVNYWLPLWNYFTPVMKLKSKTRIGGRIVKVHDEPQTPIARIINCEKVTREQKQVLLARRQDLNPFRL